MKKITMLKTAQERRSLLEEFLGISLNTIGSTLPDDESIVRTENLIGGVSLPLGVAGPIKIHYEHQTESEFFLPLATTEGALVASVNRGCKAITMGSGATVHQELVGTTRGSVFETDGLTESIKFKAWLDIHFARVAEKANATSGHLTLFKIEAVVVGERVYVRFYYDSERAMGMNMATIATTAAVLFITQETGIKCTAVAANFDIDKKPAWLNIIRGRGRRVWAEATIDKKIVIDVLKTTSQKIVDVWLSKCMIGSALSGSLGFNSHFANIVAAFFAATGQDLAHVVEGSMGITTTKVLPSGALYISIYMPDVMIGTIGGGTSLLAQKEALGICGVKDPADLAFILGGGVLAGELSLLASLAQGSLAEAHAKLGR